MHQNKHVALIFPPHAASTRDCAVGYSRAFQQLNVHCTNIHYEEIWEQWEKVIQSTSLNTATTYERATADVVFKVLECQPDIVFIVDGTSIHDIFWDWMHRLNIPTVAILTECPYRDKTNSYIVERATHTFANDLSSAEVMGIDFLPLAYSQEIHHPMIVSSKYRSDVVFVGSGFPERQHFLEQVDWSGIDFKLFGYWKLDDSPLKKFFNQDDVVLRNDEAAQYYNGAKIVLNLDRVSVDFQGQETIPGRESVGPRIYEAAACGATIASQDTIPELSDLLGENYLPFATPNELEGILRKWIRDEKRNDRMLIGRGARSAVANHSYLHRAQYLLRKLSIIDN